jgi:surface carbohydrate biosynthesis protein (TIGR04326 family)
VDAYILGLPVVIMLDESDLNFSPLRGRDGIKFVGSPAELADALQVEGPPAQGTLARAEFFYIDPEFSRWRQLLLS